MTATPTDTVRDFYTKLAASDAPCCNLTNIRNVGGLRIHSVEGEAKASTDNGDAPDRYVALVDDHHQRPVAEQMRNARGYRDGVHRTKHVA
jgi:hypothetical protein